MVSIMIPALNEEQNLRSAVLNAIDCAKSVGDVAIEIIIVNDGSTDGTANVIKGLEKEFPIVRSVHHERNIGIGASFIEAIKIAKYDKITLFPGDNAVSSYTLKNLLRNAGKADFVGAYIVNTESRSFVRHFISALFSLIYIMTFRLHLKYIHATPVYSVACLKKLRLNSMRYSLFSEINVKLLRKGATFLEIEGYMNPAVQKSSAIKLKNLIEVIGAYLRLIYEVYFLHRETFSKKPLRIKPPDA